MNCIKPLLFLFFMHAVYSFGQISSGYILFERKTNLKKRFAGIAEMEKMIRDDNKIRTDQFELLFNDSLSAFLPIKREEEDSMSWSTTSNEVFQHLSAREKLTGLDLNGSTIYVRDLLHVPLWKITNSTRYIAGYKCQKAFYETTEGLRVYAWFTIEILSSTGPEGFSGLPGMILGIATEDGGIVYFAQQVEKRVLNPDELMFNEIKSKIYTLPELEKKIESEPSNRLSGKQMFSDLYKWL